MYFEADKNSSLFLRFETKFGLFYNIKKLILLLEVFITTAIIYTYIANNSTGLGQVLLQV